jgi:hypothetical protein
MMRLGQQELLRDVLVSTLGGTYKRLQLYTIVLLLPLYTIVCTQLSTIVHNSTSWCTIVHNCQALYTTDMARRTPATRRSWRRRRTSSGCTVDRSRDRSSRGTIRWWRMVVFPGSFH